MKKLKIKEDESQADSLKRLPQQGKLIQIATPEAASIWAKAIQYLPQHVFKFAFNAHITATDLKPNTVRWNDDKTISLVELTAHFEISFEAAVERKEDRYLSP